MSEPYDRCAVVVGLCSHGLSIVRSLGKDGIRVFAFETNLKLPGAYSRYLELVPVKGINGPELLEELINFSTRKKFTKKPVLFFTNDNMVLLAINNMQKLIPHYLISWRMFKDNVGSLLYKDKFAEYCKCHGLAHPKSIIIRNSEDIEKAESELKLPIALKPCRPLSSFKAIKILSYNQLSETIQIYKNNIPMIAQEWISGGHKKILLTNLYLSNGKSLSHFEGRKLRSYPPLVGAASAVQQINDKNLFEETIRFFRPLKLSGPVALEFKEDNQGKRWIIEATVGRTEYLVEACIKAGINLPVVEYCHQAGYEIPAPKKKAVSTIWVDTERDPDSLLCLLKWFWAYPFKIVLAFPYLSIVDPLPFVRALKIRITYILKKLIR